MLEVNLKTTKMSEKTQQRSNQSGRGHQGRRNNFRFRGNGNRKNDNRGKPKGEFKPKCKGECEDLGSNVCFIGDARQADNHTKVTEVIIDCVRRTCVDGEDAKWALENGKPCDFDSQRPTLGTPSTPPPSTTPKKAAKLVMKTEPDEEDEVHQQQMKEIQHVFQAEIRQFVDRKGRHRSNVNKACALILGQCTLGLKNKLENLQDWTTVRDDPMEMLKAVRAITHDHQDSKRPMLSTHKSIKTLFTIKQDEKESLTEFVKRFKNARDIMEAQHGELPMTQCVASTLDSTATDDEKKKAQEVAYNRLIGCAFIQGASNVKAGKLEEDLANSFALKQNQHPENLETAVDAVVNCRNCVNNPHHPGKKRNDRTNGKGQNTNKKDAENTSDKGTAASFAQKGKNDKGQTVCFKCGEPGHIAPKCPNKDKDETANAQSQGASKNSNADTTVARDGDNDKNFSTGWNSLQMHEHAFLNEANSHETMKTWLLLDNQSTADIARDKNLVTNIRKVPDGLKLLTNGGVMKTQLKADVPGCGTVWCHPEATTNILSLAKVKQKCRVQCDSAQGDEFNVHLNKRVMKFKPSKVGLHHCDLSQGNAFNFVETVEENRFPCSDRQFKRAKLARSVCHAIGNPSLADFKKIVQMNSLKNCPVTQEDIETAENTFGPDVSTLKGKTTDKPGPPAVNDCIEIPEELKRVHKNVDLCADVFCVCGVMFLLTCSKNIQHITVEHLKEKSQKTLHGAFDNAFDECNKADFRIAKLHVDPEFAFMKDTMLENDIELQEWLPESHNPKVNVGAAQSHQVNAERMIRTIKDRHRCMWHRMPCKAMPIKMIVAAVEQVAKWLNAFPPSGGLSRQHSPRVIMNKRQIDCDEDCCVSFGSHVQVFHKQETTHNTPRPRTIGGICLGAMDNEQGGHRVMNLATGATITRTQVKVVPITEDVVQRVEFFARKDGVKEDTRFKTRRGEIIPDQGDDALIAGVDKQNNTGNTAEQSHQEDEEVNDREPEPEEMASDEDTDEEDAKATLELRNAGTNAAPPDIAEDDDESQASDQTNTENNQNHQNPDQEHHEDDEQDDEVTVLRRSNRQRQKPTRLVPTMTGQQHEETNHLIVQSNKDTAEHDEQCAVVIAKTIAILRDEADGCNVKDQASFIQTCTLKQGIKKFGDRGTEAALKEIGQLHERNCFEPVQANESTFEQRKKVLESLMFLTEKRDGTVKARQCADGSKQRIWTDKRETASPTVSLESILLTATIEAKEHREVAVADTPDAFIQTENEGETVHMKTRGELAHLLTSTAPHICRECLTHENGRPVLCLKVLKASHGLLKSALSFYKKLRGDLEKIGFKANPCDPCVANKTAFGSQMTLTWHVDDMKISHQSNAVIESFIEWVRMMHEDVTPVKVSRGKVHDCLGMILDCSTPGVVKVKMTDAINEMLQDFPHKSQFLTGRKKPSTPATEWLFKVNPNGKKLDKNMRETFHTCVAKCSFTTKRMRADIQVAVAFLCTRVREPDQDDWNKLIRMLSCLKCNAHLHTTLMADAANVAEWAADVAFAVHRDFKSHTGAGMSLGKGAVTTNSLKQKIMTKCSTSAELVGADETTNGVLWSKCFLEEQGHDVKATVLLQDNQSTILLEKNGKESSSRRTRHLHIRCFHITDLTKRGETDVEHRNTHDLWADFLSKPLQGAKFFKFRRQIMNLPPDADARAPRQ